MLRSVKFLVLSMLMPLSVVAVDEVNEGSFSRTRMMEKAKASRLDAPTATLEVGEGVLKQDLNISISSIREANLPKLDKGMTNVTDSFSGYRFLPHGEHFAGKGAKVVLGYDRTKIPSGYTEDDIRTYYYDETEKRWIPLQRDSIDRKNRQIISRTTHFTDMINGVIQAPESPETQGFAPTMMSDLQAADPTSKVQMIQAPQANQTGSASLQYSLEMPPARNGMSPNLAIQYSSDAASGWLGEGWNLTTSSITVDTRWGVPRYNPGIETETYLLDGQMLLEDGVGLAHRNPGQNRKTGRVVFRPRKESAFSEIVRIGDSPSNYIWEVTDRRGTKYTYGEYKVTESKDENGEPVKDTTIVGVLKGIYKGNREVISQWMLTRIEEVHGDYVEYKYNDVKEEVYGNLTSNSIYLDSVYAGNVGEDPHTKVVFISNTNKYIQRNNGNFGYLTSSNKLLDSVVVFFENEKLRSYSFTYDKGSFETSLLASIQHRDSKGKLFNQHTFSYHNDYKGDLISDEKEDNFSTGNDISGFANAISGSYMATALGGTRTTSSSFNTYVGAGIADFGPTKSNTGGISYAHSKLKSKGDIALVDLDGDGLPDKVIREGDQVYYRKNITADDEKEGDFAEKLPVKGLSEFAYSVNKSNTFGAKVHLGFGDWLAVAGVDYGRSTSETSVYFSDVNADGLVDVVKNGKVLFNKLDENGVPTFSEGSNGTFNPINQVGGDLSFEPMTEEEIKEFNEEQEAIINESPMQDIVRVWKAPKSGTITISGNPELIVDYSDADEDEDAALYDGVVVSLETKGESMISDKLLEKKEKGNEKFDGYKITVSKGQNLYFRVQSGDQQMSNGWQDKVKWSPVVTYDGESYVDPDGFDTNVYDSKDGFEISADATYPLDTMTVDKERVNSSAYLSGMFKKAVTSDDVVVQVIMSSNPKIEKCVKPKNEEICVKYKEASPDCEETSFVEMCEETETIDNPNYRSVVVFEKKYRRDEAVEEEIELPDNLLEKFVDSNGESILLNNISFKIVTNTNVAFDKIDWTPKIHYTVAESMKDRSFEDRDEYCVVDKSIYSNVIGCADKPFLLPVLTESEISNFVFEPILSDVSSLPNLLSYLEQTVNETFLLSIKDKDNKYNKQYEVKYDFSKNKFVSVDNTHIKPFTVEDYKAGKEVWISLYFPKKELKLDFPISFSVQTGVEKESVDAEGNVVYSIEKTFKSEINVYSRSGESFGPMYRGWGQFVYSAAGDRYSKPIDEASLDVEMMSKKFEGMEDSSDPENYKDMSFNDFPLVLLNPDAKNHCWKGQNPNSYIYSDRMSSARLGEQNVVLKNPMDDIIDGLNSIKSAAEGTKAYAIKMVTKNQSLTELAGVSHFTGQNSDGWGGSKQMFTDMNGDGYPDIVTEKQIMYTNPLGGFQDGGKYHGSHLTDHATSHSNTIGGGMSPQQSQPINVKTHTCGKNVQLSVNSSDRAQVNLSANLGLYSGDKTEESMVDINGDGLPDKVYVDKDDVYAYLNLGYEFSETAVKWGNGFIRESNNNDVSLGLGVDIGASSFSAGVGIAATFNRTKKDLRDVNGDGLVDLVDGSKGEVRLNTGHGFGPKISWNKKRSEGWLSSTASASMSANGNATVSVSIPIISVKFSVTGGGSGGTGVNGELLSYMDIDGDGFMDYVTAPLGGQENLNVKYSSIGATNKLHTVTNPFGGTFSIDYAHTQPTTDHPGGKWAMSALTVNDGTGMNPEMKTTFSYEGGKHDRRERDFLGFGKVTTTNMDGENKVRSVIVRFDVDNYLIAGTPIHTEEIGYKSEEETQKYKEDAISYAYFKAGKNGSLKEIDRVKEQFIEKISDTEYVVLGDDASVFYAPKEKSTKVYEEDAELDLTKEMYAYSTSYGNLSTYQFIDLTNNVGYSDTITYSNPKLGLATDVKIYGSDGKLYRHVSASYKDKKTPYAMTQMVQYIDDEKKAIFNFEYDKTGNMIRKTFPNGDKSSKQDSMFFKYTYDRKYNMYPERVEDAFGYHSEMEDYDYRYGTPKTVRDMNGYTVLYEFDDLGRTAKIIAPKEQREGKGDGKEYTVSYEYNDKGDYKSRYAITNHYDPQHPENPIQTVTHVDGLGRSFQVKKDAEIEGVEKMIVSGRVEYDHLGRTIATYHPSTCDLTSKTGIAPFGDRLLNSSTYDVIDRPLSQTLPGDESGEIKEASVTTVSYSIDKEKKARKTTISDPRKSVHAYINGAGKTFKTSKMLNSEEVSIDYEFDPIGQLLSVKDAGGNVTAYTYDNAGRKLSVEHPSAGLTTFVYDVAGNMIERQTPNLREKEQSIKHKYEKNRLMEVVYPEHVENNVKCTYGGVNAEHNRAGRLAMIEDGSGAQEFFYGSMGELTKQRRTLVIPNQAVATYTTEWKYDSHNRLEEMTYPDGEVISYKYNLGGLLSSVVGKKEFQYTYVENIGYDEYEQRNYVKYGNGTETSYDYSSNRRRLSNLKVTSPAYNGEDIMNNSYTYDAMDNITKLFNSVNAKGAKKEGKTLAGALLHRYTYDDWNRLIEAEGFYSDDAETVEESSMADYHLQMEYDKLYNVTSKKLEVKQTNMQFDGTLRAGHQLTYQYDENDPFKLLSVHASEYRVSDESADIEKAKVNTRADYAFDKNGNQISVGTGAESEDDQSLRKLLWDEDDRLLAVSDNGFVSNYFYDAEGDRTVKVAASQEALFVNSASVKDSMFSQRFVAYVSPYFVVKNGGEYTKHIYAGSQRIASKVGDFESFGADPRRVAMAGADVPNSKVSYADKYTALIERMSNDYDSLGVEYNIKDNNDFKNNESFCCDKTNSLGGYSSFEGTSAEEVSKESLVFFYHPDHLGSTGLVTDAEGVITQHVAYIPYGEVFVEERNGVWNTPYLFNAKELDEETGLYYYGARYLNPKDTRWLSVDPMFEMYVGVSPYVYCMGNPVVLVDPDGNAVYGNPDNLQEGGASYVIGPKDVIDEHLDDVYKGFVFVDDTNDYLDEDGNPKDIPPFYNKDGEYVSSFGDHYSNTTEQQIVSEFESKIFGEVDESHQTEFEPIAERKATKHYWWGETNWLSLNTYTFNYAGGTFTYIRRQITDVEVTDIARYMREFGYLDGDPFDFKNLCKPLKGDYKFKVRVVPKHGNAKDSGLDVIDIVFKDKASAVRFYNAYYRKMKKNRGN